MVSQSSYAASRIPTRTTMLSTLSTVTILSTFLLLPQSCDALVELAYRHKLYTKHSPRLNITTPPVIRDTPGVQNCTLNWYTATIDHFSWVSPPAGSLTYQQRYFTYDKYWDPVNGVIFAYLGNEADVTLYVDHTGLMWENAQEHKALIIFMEHRYYGLSQPFGDASQNILQYLTHEQALADYVDLIHSFQTNHSTDQSVIIFGGSYGGMEVAWAMNKYPGIFAGGIAASAPILAFHGMTPEYYNNSYWKVVTADATAAGGSAPACAANVQAAFSAIFTAGQSADGLANLSNTFQMCTPLQDMDDVSTLALFHLNAWDTMAMGNYPYASNYLTGGGPLLPAWPIRASCEYLKDPTLATGDPWALLAAFEAAGNVFNNATANIACYTLPTDIWEDGIWDYQWCTELVPEETYFNANGDLASGGDMFYPRNFNLSFVQAHCYDKFGVIPRPEWIRVAYGNAAMGTKNVVFSNGGMDPWSSGGVKVAPNADTAVVFMPNGAHHIDLFFSNPQDTPDIVAGRQTEMTFVKQWIAQWNAEKVERLAKQSEL